MAKTNRSNLIFLNISKISTKIDLAVIYKREILGFFVTIIISDMFADIPKIIFMKNLLFSFVFLLALSSYSQQREAENYCEYTQVARPSVFINDFFTEGGETNISNLDSGYSPGGYQDATSMIVTQHAGGEILFSADFNENLLGFNIWVDWDDDKEFSESEKVFRSGTYYSAITGHFEVPIDVPAGDYRMRIVGDWLYENPPACGQNLYGGEAEDYTVRVTNATTCMEPVALKATGITENSSKISWTDYNDAEEWQLIYGPSGFDPQTTGTTLNVSGSPTTTLTNLNANASYDVYVKTLCSEDDVSSLSLVTHTFFTACDPSPLPYVLNLDDVAIPELPDCSREEKISGGRTWETQEVNQFGFDGSVLAYSFSSTPADAWFFTNGVSLNSGVDYKLKYTYGTNLTNYTESFKVAYGFHPDSENMDVELIDHPDIKNVEAEINEIIFSVNETGTYYFGFYVYSDAFQDKLFISDISVEEDGLAIEENIFSDIKIFPNPTSSIINISHPSIEKVEFLNLTGQTLLTNKIDSGNLALDISHYPSGTYFLRISTTNSYKVFKVIKI